MSIKERLRLVIESQKLTVKDFAELVDTPLRTVHNYLNSGKEPSTVSYTHLTLPTKA